MVVQTLSSGSEVHVVDDPSPVRVSRLGGSGLGLSLTLQESEELCNALARANLYVRSHTFPANFAESPPVSLPKPNP